MNVDNLFASPHGGSAGEVFKELLHGGAFRLERIVSTSQTTPPGEWYDQPQAEWVLLLSGRARLRFEEESEPRELRPGDYVNIPPHCRHRVEFTALDEQTVWLALHYQ